MKEVLKVLERGKEVVEIGLTWLCRSDVRVRQIF